MKKHITKEALMLVAFLITIIIFLAVILIGNRVGDSREAYIDTEMQSVYRDISEIQTFFLMSESYGDEMACVAFRTKLRDLDKSTWNLGVKLDQYRGASEEFFKNPFYLEQKKLFNENQLTYMMLLTHLKQRCGFTDQVIVSFYYKKAEDCGKCDDQSYVLTDINQLLDDRISIFSYDTDLDLSTIDVLTQYYNLSDYPCTVVEDKVFCGIRDKEFLMNEICTYLPEEPLCQ